MPVTLDPPRRAAGFDLAADIRRLKEERRAVILAHNYQVAEIQDVADYVGDSSACPTTPGTRTRM